jgi:hypothetical protein
MQGDLTVEADKWQTQKQVMVVLKQIKYKFRHVRFEVPNSLTSDKKQ